MSTRCILCGDACEKDSCPVCFRMRVGAARIFADMYDLASLAKHLCSIGKATLEHSSITACATSCSLRVRNKWPGIRRRHTRVLHFDESDLLTRDELCAKLPEMTRCSYCQEYPASGLDRMDAAQGYTKKNTIPCCVLCNFIKNQMSVTAFLEHAQKVCAHWSHTCDHATCDAY